MEVAYSFIYTSFQFIIISIKSSFSICFDLAKESRFTQDHHLNILCRAQVPDAVFQVSRSSACWFWWHAWMDRHSNGTNIIPRHLPVAMVCEIQANLTPDFNNILYRHFLLAPTKFPITRMLIYQCIMTPVIPDIWHCFASWLKYINFTLS